MLLAIDVGNTQTVVGVFDGPTLSHTWRVSTAHAKTADELRLELRGLLDAACVTDEEITGCALASVVPLLRSRWKQAIHDAFAIETVEANTQTAEGLVDCRLRNAEQVGADRIADAAAARKLYGAPVVVVDFGTATNMEIIDEKGTFAGGIIAPGIETSMDALFSHAAQLYAIDLADPGTVLGGDTREAMQVGIVYGEADRVDGLIARIWDELGYKTPVVATGGLAVSMAKLCRTITATDTDLTLQGLRLIFEANKR